MNSNPRRLYRTSDDRIIAGVAGGVAAYFDVDPIIVRILWILSVPVTASMSFWAYVIMIFVVPEEPAEWPAQSPWAPGGAPTGFSANYAPPAATGSVPPADGPTGVPGDAPAATGPWPDAASGNSAYGAPNAAGFADVPGQPPTPNAPWTGNWRSQRRQDRWQRRSDRLEARRERGGSGLIFGLLLILVGGLLAWHQVDPNFDVNVTWPVAIVAIGLILVVSSIRRDKRD
jgi:phage shock protein C